MHGLKKSVTARARNEGGAVALMVAVSLAALVIASAFVLDFGLVRVDRQVNKSAADAATSAGIQNLRGDDGNGRPFAGVCAAISYLQANGARFADLSPTTGTWTDGASPANPKPTSACDPTSPLLEQICVAGSPATWARFQWDGTWQGQPLRVVIQSGYELSGSGWAEESLAAVAADNSDGAQGCSQLAVIITQNREPGLGSLATSAELVSSVRTVGRVKLGPGGYAPALLLLKRTGCPVLSTGGSGGGSHIYVYGDYSSDGKTQPGTIHADSDGLNCTGGSNENIFLGKAGDGIVAFAAPIFASPLLPDPNKPGSITSVAGANGFSGSSTIVRDSGTNVYSSAALDEGSAPTAAKSDPTGRAPVTRKPVDERYLAGVKGIVDTAYGTVFSTLNAGNAVTRGYTLVSGCNATGTFSGTRLFIDCLANTGYKGDAVLNAPEVVFNGRVNPSATVSMPIATKVYIFGRPGRAAIELGGSGAAFKMHTAGNLDGTLCSSDQSSARGLLVVRDGSIKQQNGTQLQLCKTTVVMMGGQADACLPSPGYANAPAPMAKPCALSAIPTEGTGQLSQTGGTVDWTAPNEWDNMMLDDGEPDPALAPSWSDPDGPEDLAFWSESGTSSSETYNMAGSGDLNAVGVYMVPNADPFIINGTACQILTDAQYIATSISLGGNFTCIKMKVDPNAAVTVPQLVPVGLVR